MKSTIFQALDKKYIYSLFLKKRKIFFPEIKGDIAEIKIAKTSPEWARDNCLVRYEVFFSNGEKTIVRGTADAKKSKEKIWFLMNYLWNNGFNKGNLLIPRPVGYIRDINLLLYKEAPGEPLTRLIEKNRKKDIKNFLIGTAGWLAKLHSLSVPRKKIDPAVFLGFNGYVEIMRKIRRYFPELKNKLISSGKLKFVEKEWQKSKVLIHNDFYPGNFIIGKRTFFGIDFDRAGIGPYFMDLATLFVALEFPQNIWKSNISRKDGKNYQKIFLKKYCEIRDLDYIRVSQEIKNFLVKILLDQIHYYTSFAIKGKGHMSVKNRKILTSKIKALLIKAEKGLAKI